MIRRPYTPKFEPITVLFEQKTLPMVDVMTWYEEYSRRAKFLFEKFRVQLTTPRRPAPPKFDGYVPGPTVPWHSDNVKIRGVSGDSHRAAHR